MAANDETGEHGPDRSAKSCRLCRFLVILVLAAGVSLAAFTGLARVPLFQPIEGLNSNIAQSMIESGDWCVPRHNGCVYVDKPPLFYWVTTIGLQIFGDTEFGARFGLALVGLGEVLLIYFLGRLLYGQTAGLLSAAVLATSIGHMKQYVAAMRYWFTSSRIVRGPEREQRVCAVRQWFKRLLWRNQLRRPIVGGLGRCNQPASRSGGKPSIGLINSAIYALARAAATPRPFMTSRRATTSRATAQATITPWRVTTCAPAGARRRAKTSSMRWPAR